MERAALLKTGNLFDLMSNSTNMIAEGNGLLCAFGVVYVRCTVSGYRKIY